MKCLLCSKSVKNINRKYCSRTCAEKSKWGRKRPDLVLRNKTNNPIWDKEALEKMRQAQIGKKHSIETKVKMSISQKAYNQRDPRRIMRMLSGAEEKYLSRVRGTGWRKIRTEVLKRDNYNCQQCGTSRQDYLVVHHKDWNGRERGKGHRDMNNDLNNLITLCHKCHNGIHRHKSNDYQERKAKIAP